jgi:hypothetical protein
MTLRAMISVCCGVLVLLAPAQAFSVECATEAQRKIEIEKLNESVDWFLSTVEEVPEDIAQQFRAAVSGRAAAANGPDMNAFRQAIAHPLWATHMLKESGAIIKHELRLQTPDTPVAQLRKAISALERSAPFIHQLSNYAAKDRGRRLTNVNDWTRRPIDLPGNLADYAQCLVDLVSSGAGSSSPATPQ